MRNRDTLGSWLHYYDVSPVIVRQQVGVKPLSIRVAAGQAHQAGRGSKNLHPATPHRGAWDKLKYISQNSLAEKCSQEPFSIYKLSESFPSASLRPNFVVVRWKSEVRNVNDLHKGKSNGSKNFQE